MNARLDLSGMRVLIIGAARQGMALARYLAKNGVVVLLNDLRPKEELQNEISELAGLPIEWSFGGHPLSLLKNIDLVCPSGGVPLNIPLIVEAVKKGIPLSNDSQIFLERAPCKVIGITGSAGKTTTTTLVGRMACDFQEKTGQIRRVFVGGNIGQPMINFLDEISENDLVVMELSSFQLEIMTMSPQIAVILNISPNHLDRHESFENYITAKAKILEFQPPGSIAILNREDPGSWSLRKLVSGTLNTFGVVAPQEPLAGTFLSEDQLFFQDISRKELLFPKELIQLRGEHNLRNVLAACAICVSAGIPPVSMQAGLQSFVGVDHRLQFVRRINNIDWYNDSIATAPERVIASILSFDEPLVLLTGGRDKNLPWDDFARLVRSRVDHLILFGEAAPIIYQAISSIRQTPKDRLQSISSHPDLRDALTEAFSVAQPGDVVLLAPGGTSFDEFRDFEERGNYFKKWVSEII